MAKLGTVAVLVIAIVALIVHGSEGAIPRDVQRKINEINKNGPYIGLVIPNTFEMNPLLQSDSFTASKDVPILDFAGRRFRFGSIEGRKVILVMTGLSMTNAGVTTQLLLALFRIEGVVHYGIAGNANPSLNIGDVTIARYWGHSGLWNWQRYGDGPDNELSLESNGDYTREFGFLKFSDYTVGATDGANATYDDNLLNNLWYQPEEVFPVDGTPEERQHILWVPVDATYFSIAKQLQGVELEKCLNVTTCLTHAPKVTMVLRGTSANIFLDNAAYRDFIFHKFQVSPVEMESAAVALICHQQRVPHITIRALSDLAGGGSTNEADTFTFLAVTNCIKVVVQFIKSLGLSQPPSRGYQTF